MRYQTELAVRQDARRVSLGWRLPTRQDSLTDQLTDLRVLANHFGLYDADDFLQTLAVDV